MLISYRSFQHYILGPSIVMLALGSTAAIYRPISNSALIVDIMAANSSPDDDIIDLGGQIFVINDACSVTNPMTCSDSHGLNAFPAIKSAIGSPQAGKLSIINGTIQRNTGDDDDGDDPDVDNFRFFDVLPGADFTLFNITLAYGFATTGGTLATASGSPHILAAGDNGGAIYNGGNLKLQNSTIIDNTANGDGGAIFNASGGILDIQSSNISDNTALNVTEDDGGGGAIYNEADAFIDSIDNSTISGNSTPGNGGGINNHGSADNIFGTTISRNNCCFPVDGGECPDPPTGLGGGIYNDGEATLLYVVNSTIANNSAYQGGGIFNNSNAGGDMLFLHPNGVFIYNTTISRNAAHGGGGGIYNNNNSNTGGVAIIDFLISNIVAGNTDTSENSIATPDIQNFAGPSHADISNYSNNLVGNNNGVQDLIFPGDGHNDISGTPDAPIDPRLDGLEYNGGFTATMALLPRSQALNNGLNPLKLKYDQRGRPFHRVACSRPDIGAYELKNCFSVSIDESICPNI